MVGRVKGVGFWSPEGIEPKIKENRGQGNKDMEKESIGKQLKEHVNDRETTCLIDRVTMREDFFYIRLGASYFISNKTTILK